MAKGYRPVDRDQQFLLPPDMRSWLPDDHPVWVLIDAVGMLNTSELHARCRTGGAGRAGYDPDMLLTLLFYAYARGIRSSRQIERLCWEDVAFRVICTQDVPDHVTLWRFADMDPALVEKLFGEVLALCAKSGMGRLETIALDGMKIGANASKAANRTEESIRAELARTAARAVAEHRATDTAENILFGQARGDELPEELADPRKRRPRLRRALSDLEAERTAEQAEREAKAEQHLQRLRDGERLRGSIPNDAQVKAAQLRLQRAITAQQAKIDDWERRNAEKIAATGAGLHGGPPQPVDEHFAVVRARASLAKAQARQAEREKKQEQQPPAVRNTTDPDSRLMPTRSGLIQGYNTQNVASADGLIIATALTQDTGDVEQAEPMMRAAEQAAETITDIHGERAQTAGQECTCPTDNDAPTDQPPAYPSDESSAAPTRAACPVHPDGIGIMLFDAGYLSRKNLTAPGPDRLIATGKHRDLEKAARAAAASPDHDTTDDPPADPHIQDASADPADGQPDQDAPDPIEQMTQRLRTPEGIRTYRQRGHIAETPHARIKHNMGIRTLARRGLTRAKAEWTFIATTHNLSRLLSTLRRTARPLPTNA